MAAAGSFGTLSSAKQSAPKAFCSEDAGAKGNAGNEKFAFRKTMYEESIKLYIAAKLVSKRIREL